MDFRGNKGNNNKRGNPHQKSSSSSSRYNVTPNQQDQMNQLLLQQYFLQEQQQQGGGGGGSGSAAAAQAAAAAALFGGLIGDKLGGGGAREQQQQQISELFAAAAAAQQQQQQQRPHNTPSPYTQQHQQRSSSNTPSPSPRISSPHHPHHQLHRNQQTPPSSTSSSSAAATAAAIQQLTAAAAAAAALQQPSSKSGGKESNAAALNAAAAQQQWMYLDYLQRIQQDVQAQAALAAVAQQQQHQASTPPQQQQPKQRGRSNSNSKGQKQQQQRQMQQQLPRQQQQQKRVTASSASASELQRLFEYGTSSSNANTNSILKSSVLASAKLPADTEIIVQKNNSRSSSLHQHFQKSQQNQQQQNKRGPKQKSTEQSKFEQQLINLGNNNAITITPANMETTKMASSSAAIGSSPSPPPPITITPASNNGNGGSGPPAAHSTPFRYGNDKRDKAEEAEEDDEVKVPPPAHTYKKELYTHVIPRRPQIGLIGSSGKKPQQQQLQQNTSQIRHHRPWMMEEQQQLSLPTQHKEKGRNLMKNSNTNSTPIIISPPDYSIPIKLSWTRIMTLKNFDLSEENLSLLADISYISPEGKVYNSLNEIKKSPSVAIEPKNFSFNNKIQLGRFALPPSEGVTKTFDFDELVDYFNEAKRVEVVRKCELRMKLEHNSYVKLIEAYRKGKRKLKLSEGKGGGIVPHHHHKKELDELIDDADTKLPVLHRVPGKKLNDKTFANLLQIHEFLHTFGETLGFDEESLPTLASLQKAFLHVEDNEEELVSVLCHLLVCAVEDPGLPNPTGSKHLTPFGQTLKQADVTFGSMSEILRIYLIGISDSEPEAEEYAGWLGVAPFSAQSAYRKSVLVAFVCDVLLQNKAVLRFLDNCSELIHNCKKERQQNEIRVRKLRMMVARRQVAISVQEEGEQEGGDGETAVKVEGGANDEESKNNDDSKVGGDDLMITSAGEDSIMQGDDEHSQQQQQTPNKSENNNSNSTPKANPAYAAVASVADSMSSDPDSKLSIEELNSKMNSLATANEKLKKQMQANSKSIRSTCIGQDRWRRRYWNLFYGGGIYVEGGATGEFESVREAVGEKFSKDPEQATGTESVVVKKEEPVTTATTDVKEEEITIKKEPTDSENNTTTPIATVATASTLFTVPPPVIKIFSFSPRPPCSGKSTCPDAKSDDKLTDDEVFVKNVKGAEWYDWKCLRGEDDLAALSSKLCEKGVREKGLRGGLSGFANSNKEMSGNKGGSGGFSIVSLKEEGDDDEDGDDADDEDIANHHQRNSNDDSDEGYVDPELLYKIHLGLIETLETLEERVASASLQIKGWGVPSRNLMGENLSEEQIIEIVKERVLDLEGAVERRYLKPPLGKSGLEVNLTQLLRESEDSVMSYGMLLDGPIGSTSSTRGQQINENNKLKMELKERERLEKEMQARKEKEEGGYGGKGESRFLNHWRDAISKTTSPSVLSMAIYILDSSIAWDKSVMKACCQLCKGGDNEDKLLLCDACDRGYHTYCFKPPLSNIPDGDWFCWECINKATGNKCCIVCGKGQVANGVKLLCCDKCVKAYHQDCISPPVGKAPRGRWFCADHRDGGGIGGGGSSSEKRVTLSQAVSVSILNSLNNGSGSGGGGGGGASGLSDCEGVVGRGSSGGGKKSGGESE